MRQQHHELGLLTAQQSCMPLKDSPSGCQAPKYHGKKLVPSTPRHCGAAAQWGGELQLLQPQGQTPAQPALSQALTTSSLWGTALLTETTTLPSPLSLPQLSPGAAHMAEAAAFLLKCLTMKENLRVRDHAGARGAQSGPNSQLWYHAALTGPCLNLC